MGRFGVIPRSEDRQEGVVGVHRRDTNREKKQGRSLLEGEKEGRRHQRKIRRGVRISLRVSTRPLSLAGVPFRGGHSFLLGPSCWLCKATLPARSFLCGLGGGFWSRRRDGDSRARCLQNPVGQKKDGKGESGPIGPEGIGIQGTKTAICTPSPFAATLKADLVLPILPLQSALPATNPFPAQFFRPSLSPCSTLSR